MTLSWGATALIIQTLPIATIQNSYLIKIISKIIFFWNSLYLAMFIPVFLSHRDRLKKLFNHPLLHNFTALIPMSLGVWTCSLVILFPENFNENLVFTLYIFVLCLSYVTCFYLNYVNINNQSKIEIPNKIINSVYLFPNLPNIVIAACGATILPFMQNFQIKNFLIISSYVSLGTGLSLSLCVIVCYFLRLLQFGWPGIKLVNSVWVVVGPIGHSANTLLQLARHLKNLNYDSDSYATGNFNYMKILKDSLIGPSFIFGLLLWGFAIFWLVLSFLVVFQHRNDLKFNLSYWSIIFPVATLTFSTYQLLIISQLIFFKLMAITLCLFIVLTSFTTHVITIYEVVFESQKFWRRLKN